jgi:hypothetical protein
VQRSMALFLAPRKLPDGFGRVREGIGRVRGTTSIVSDQVGDNDEPTAAV